MPFGPATAVGRGAIGIEQRGGKDGRIGTPVAEILLATINGRMGFAEHEAVRVAVEDRLRGGGLGLEHGPVGYVAVPFDKRRNGPASADHDVEELPDRVGDRPVMAVDQQKVALVVRLLGMPGQMDLAHMLERKIGEIGERRSSRDWWPRRRRC